MNNTPDNNTNIPAGNNKRSSPLLKVLPIAVLAAVLVYFAAQVYNYFADPMTITLVYEAQAEDVISMEGWLVRTEEPLPGQTGTVSRAVQEGQRVAAGETVATVYSDDSALQTVSRIETLELQLQQLQFALTSYLDPDAALKLDTSITGDILTLRQTLSAGDYAAAESDLAALKAAVLKRDHGSYTSQEEIQAQIKSVESEIQQQKAALSGAKTVTAKASGTYSAVCDGYESVLTEAFLEDVTPGKLNGVKAAAEQSNVGKLIYGDTWYYAVVLPAEQAAALKDMGRVDVRLAKGFDQSIRMSVVSVSREENGQAAVVLSSTRYLAQTTLLRHQAAAGGIRKARHRAEHRPVGQGDIADLQRFHGFSLYLFWGRRFGMRSALLCAYSEERLFLFRNSGKSADFPELPFHGRGRSGKRQLPRLFPAETAARRGKPLLGKLISMVNVDSLLKKSLLSDTLNITNLLRRNEADHGRKNACPVENTV